MIRGPKKTISFELPLERYEQLKACADREGMTLSAYLRLVLGHHAALVERGELHSILDWWERTK